MYVCMYVWMDVWMYICDVMHAKGKELTVHSLGEEDENNCKIH